MRPHMSVALNESINHKVEDARLLQDPSNIVESISIYKFIIILCGTMHSKMKIRPLDPFEGKVRNVWSDLPRKKSIWRSVHSDRVFRFWFRRPESEHSDTTPNCSPNSKRYTRLGLHAENRIFEQPTGGCYMFVPTRLEMEGGD